MGEALVTGPRSPTRVFCHGLPVSHSGTRIRSSPQDCTHQEFTCFQSVSELSFKNGENIFDLVSLMVAVLVEKPSKFSSIDTEYPFSFSCSDRNKRVSVHAVTDESVNIFRIVPLS